MTTAEHPFVNGFLQACRNSGITGHQLRFQIKRAASLDPTIEDAFVKAGYGDIAKGAPGTAGGPKPVVPPKVPPLTADSPLRGFQPKAPPLPATPPARGPGGPFKLEKPWNYPQPPAAPPATPQPPAHISELAPVDRPTPAFDRLTRTRASVTPPALLPAGSHATGEPTASPPPAAATQAGGSSNPSWDELNHKYNPTGTTDIPLSSEPGIWNSVKGFGRGIARGTRGLFGAVGADAMMGNQPGPEMENARSNRRAGWHQFVHPLSSTAFDDRLKGQYDQIFREPDMPVSVLPGVQMGSHNLGRAGEAAKEVAEGSQEGVLTAGAGGLVGKGLQYAGKALPFVAEALPAQAAIRAAVPAQRASEKLFGAGQKLMPLAESLGGLEGAGRAVQGGIHGASDPNKAPDGSIVENKDGIFIPNNRGDLIPLAQAPPDLLKHHASQASEDVKQRIAAADPVAVGKAADDIAKPETTSTDVTAVENLSKEKGWSLDQAFASYEKMDPGQKLLLWLGLGTGALGLISSLSGEGGTMGWLMTILGLGGAAGVGAHAGMFGQGAQAATQSAVSGAQGLLGGAKKPGETPAASTGSAALKQLGIPEAWADKKLMPDEMSRLMATPASRQQLLALQPAEALPMLQSAADNDPKFKSDLQSVGYRAGGMFDGQVDAALREKGLSPPEAAKFKELAKLYYAQQSG